MNEKMKIIFENRVYLRMKKAVDINTMIPNIILNPGVTGVDSDVAVDDVFDGGSGVASDCTSGIFGVRTGVDEFFLGSIREM